MRVKSSGMVPGLANARPSGGAKFANAPPRDWQGGQMPRSSPGEEGAGGIDWCTTHVQPIFIYFYFFIYFFFLHVQPMQGNQPYLAYTSLPVQ